MLVYGQNGERLRPAGLSIAGCCCPASRQHEREMAAPPQGGRGAGLFARETSKYTDLMPDGTAREFSFYMEAGVIITRPSGGQLLKRTVPRDHRPRLERARQDQARQVSVDGGSNWETGRVTGAGVDAGADPLSDAVAMARRGSRDPEPRRRQGRTMSSRRSPGCTRGSRRQPLLPQQRDLATRRISALEVSNGQAWILYRALLLAAIASLCLPAHARALRPRPGGDAGGNCGVEHRHRPRRIEPARSGQRRRQAR